MVRKKDSRGNKNSPSDEVHSVLAPFELSDETLREVMRRLDKSMDDGLADESHAVLKMLASYVRALPNGTEDGPFLALDLGGTNFRVLLITLHDKQRGAEIRSKIYRIPQSLMAGTGTQLFDHIADCLAQFVKNQELSGKLPLGFTFSFPCVQDGLTSAKLLTWTKGFKCSGVEGEDVVRLLHEAVRRRPDVQIDVVALLNDTVGTLMALAHEDPNCSVGIIVGTGTNACYLERLDRCPKLKNQTFDKEEGDYMIINTEWGAFGDDGALKICRTPFDQQVDDNSINPRKQIFEKMISGMYMGELVRLILEKLTNEGLLFEGHGSEDLFTKGKFPTKFVSEIESDLAENERTFTNTMNILDELGVENVSQADCVNVAYVCSRVSTRAAHLCAAGIAVILNRMERRKVTVGVDGSVYRFHPTFKTLLDEKVRQLLTVPCEYKLRLSEDGSGRGAALVAAVANRLQLERMERQTSQMSVNSDTQPSA